MSRKTQTESDVAKASLAEADTDAAEHQRDEALKELAALRRPLTPGYKFDRQEANSR